MCLTSLVLAFLPITALDNRGLRSGAGSAAAALVWQSSQGVSSFGGWGFTSLSEVTFPTSGLAGVWTLAPLPAPFGHPPPGTASRRSRDWGKSGRGVCGLEAPQRSGGRALWVRARAGPALLPFCPFFPELCVEHLKNK